MSYYSKAIDVGPPALEVVPRPRINGEPKRSTTIDRDHHPSPTHDGSKKINKCNNIIVFFFYFFSNFQYLNAVLAHYLHPKTIR